jgi:hypothetical protein
VTGNKEDPSAPNYDEFVRTGIHSHDDGVVHWHPFTSASVGKRAKLSVFLDVYGVELTDDKLVFPEDQRAQLPSQNETGVFEEGETQCEIDGEMKDGELKVVVWNNFSDTDDGTTYVADFDNIRVANDAMVFSIAFVPSGADVGMPPWAANLPELGAADSNQVIPEQPGVTTVPGESVPPSSTVAPADSIVADPQSDPSLPPTTLARSSGATTTATPGTVESGG